MNRLTIEESNAMAQRTTKDLIFPTNGVKVTLKRFTLDECAQIEEVTKAALATYGGDTPEANRQVDVFICSLALIDEHGNHTHNSDEGRASLEHLPDLMRKRIRNVAMGMVGLDGVEPKN